MSAKPPRLPADRKNYTKKRPMQFEEFAGCLAWWKERVENERAWKVAAADIAANNFNLDIKNPNRPEDYAHMPPEQLAIKGWEIAGEDYNQRNSLNIICCCHL